MKISKSAWYYRLYLRAYSEDRGWLEWFRGIDYSLLPDGIPEAKEMAEWEKRFLNCSVYDKGYAHIRATCLHVRTQYNEAYARTFAMQRQERAQKVRRQLESGMMSLCPFFWKVVSAVFIYLVLFGTLRWAVNALIVRSAKLAVSYSDTMLIRSSHFIRECALVGLVVVAFVGVGGAIVYYPTWQRNRQVAAVEEARLEAERLAYNERRRVEEENYRNLEKLAEIEEDRQNALYAEEQRKYYAEQAALAKQKAEERLRWEAEHPEEVAAEKARADEKRRWSEQQLTLAISMAESNQHLRANREHAANLEWWFGALIGFIYFLVGLEGFLFLVLVLCRLAPRFIPILDRLPDWVELGWVRITDGLLFWGIVAPIMVIGESRVGQVVVRGYRALQRFWADTAHLVREFGKAKYRRMCPFLQVMDDTGDNLRA